MDPIAEVCESWIHQSERGGDFDTHAIAVLARDGIARGRTALRAARVLRDVVDVLQPCGALFVRHDLISDLDGGLAIADGDVFDALVFAPGPDIVDTARRMVRQWEEVAARGE